jgi:hypothetical protein
VIASRHGVVVVPSVVPQRDSSAQEVVDAGQEEAEPTEKLQRSPIATLASGAA